MRPQNTIGMKINEPKKMWTTEYMVGQKGFRFGIGVTPGNAMGESESAAMTSIQPSVVLISHRVSKAAQNPSKEYGLDFHTAFPCPDVTHSMIVGTESGPDNVADGAH